MGVSVSHETRGGKSFPATNTPFVRCGSPPALSLSRVTGAAGGGASYSTCRILDEVRPATSPAGQRPGGQPWRLGLLPEPLPQDVRGYSAGGLNREHRFVLLIISVNGLRAEPRWSRGRLGQAPRDTRKRVERFHDESDTCLRSPRGRGAFTEPPLERFNESSLLLGLTKPQKANNALVGILMGIISRKHTQHPFQLLRGAHFSLLCFFLLPWQTTEQRLLKIALFTLSSAKSLPSIISARKITFF